MAKANTYLLNARQRHQGLGMGGQGQPSQRHGSQPNPDQRRGAAHGRPDQA
jgi:hypothetical protein